MSITRSSQATHSTGIMSWNRHWPILAIAAAILLAATLLEVLPNERVALRGLTAYPLPHVCTSRVLFGVSCPGCGLTRSFVHLAHGDWQAAWHVHHLGWLIAALVVGQIPYRTLILAGAIRPIGDRASLSLAFVTAGLLISNWLILLATSCL
ncbi:MAG TPA: DUF2752 domain-containing protein [Pirellulales bacterium]|nr:DUF2752 domain-containing protein [Pirellulales bacterium]